MDGTTVGTLKTVFHCPNLLKILFSIFPQNPGHSSRLPWCSRLESAPRKPLPLPATCPLSPAQNSTSPPSSKLPRRDSIFTTRKFKMVWTVRLLEATHPDLDSAGWSCLATSLSSCFFWDDLHSVCSSFSSLRTRSAVTPVFIWKAWKVTNVKTSFRGKVGGGKRGSAKQQPLVTCWTSSSRNSRGGEDIQQILWTWNRMTVWSRYIQMDWSKP